MTLLAGAEPEPDGIDALLRARTGFVVSPARRGDIANAIRKIMKEFGIAEPAEYLNELHTNQDLLDQLISEVMVGETYFFRTPSHFTFIRDVVVPDVRKRRGPNAGLRVWSAGCATGEEAYSVAIVLDEERASENSLIVATDISRRALAKARAAIYGSWSLRGDGARYIGQYLRREGTQYRLAPDLRKRVHFSYLNLAHDALPLEIQGGLLDLVLCRNVLIYLDGKTVAAVARRLHDSLGDEGFLIIGPSDPPLNDFAPFETITTPGGLIYRKKRRSRQPMPVPPPIERPFLPAESASPPRSDERADVVPRADEAPQAEAERGVPEDPISEARRSFARGENTRVLELTESLVEDEAAASLRLRAIANSGDPESAGEHAAALAENHASSPEINFLSAILFMRLHRYEEARRYLDRVLYLDRSLAIAQFTLGIALHRLGDVKGAARAYRAARNLSARCRSEDVVPLSEGETAAQLFSAAGERMATLEMLMGRERE